MLTFLTAFAYSTNCVITGFSPIAAPMGASVAITGTNFSTNPAGDVVYFGAVRAQVTSASVTNLTVTVPAGAVYGPITATVNGRTAYTGSAFLPTFAGGGLAIDANSFAPSFNLSADNGPIQVVLADLDGDGNPDLLVANAYDHTISIYRNTSTNGLLAPASFAPRITFQRAEASDSPLNVLTADIDGDGKLDLVVPDYAASVVSIYRNLSTPGNISTNSFAAPVNFPVGPSPRGVAVMDLDGDGRPEIVTANTGNATVSILRNLASPGALTTNSFAPEFELPVGDSPQAVAVADLDGDGLPDLMVANANSAFVSIYQNIGSPTGISSNSFAPRLDLPAMTGCIAITAGDLDSDGQSELLFGSYSSQTIAVCRNLATPGLLTTNSFAPRIEFGTPGRVHNIVLSDVNGDAKPDVVIVTELNSALSVFQNVSTPGTFTNTSLAARVDYGTGFNAWGVAVGDLNGDGRPDIVFANSYDPSISIYQNVVASPPVIVSEPAETSVTQGLDVTLSVTAAPPLALTYQWLFRGAPITGATNATLTLTNVLFSQAGLYAVLVTNTFGWTPSSNALLTVDAPVLVGGINVSAGGIATVPIILDASGQENGLGFSLNFDPAVLTYMGATLSGGAPGAVLFANTSLLNSGKLGLALALPSGSTFAAGTQQVLQVSFSAAIISVANASTEIDFADHPTPRQLWDPQFNPLGAAWFGAAVSVAAATAFEGDVFPRPGGDNSVTLLDWLQVGRYVARLDYPTNAAEFQQADCAPRSTLGDGAIKVTDWVQAGRYAAGLDPLTPAGGPTNELAVAGAGPSALRLITLSSTPFMPGQGGTVSLNLASQGNENALGFSLSFNPAAVAFTSANLGGGAGGATLYVNTNQVSSGRVGVALALGVGGAFAAGTRELVRANFRPLPGTTGSFGLTFTDQPVPREVSDASATALPASFVNAVLAINSPLVLRIARSNQNIILAWPLWATNFSLQEASPALTPAGGWTNLSVTAAASNNENVVVLPLGSTNKFYRLFHP